MIPGFINYKYRDGEIPGHTKSAFTEYKILTIHGIITQNTLIFIRKIRNFHSLLPPPIVATISQESPVIGSTHVTCENWLKFYDNYLYRTSVFYKGPLLVMGSKLEENLSPASYITMKCYKKNIKCAILDQQGSGEATQWHSSNFPLQNIHGLRRSCAKYRTTVDYNEITTI